VNTRRRVWRSWPWTIALATVLGGLALLGLAGLGLNASTLGSLISLLVTVGAGAGLLRVLATGVRATPTGLIIRELTRTTRVPWTQVRGVDSRPTERPRVFAPVLLLAPERAVKGGRRGRAAEQILQVRVLGSYREAVAQRRADELAEARAESTDRARRP